MSKRLLPTLLALGAALLLSCSSNGGFHKEQSNDVSIDKSQLLFARPINGKTESDPLTVRISSAGATNLTINKIYLESPLTQCDRQELNLGPFEPLPGELDTTCDFEILDKPALPKVMPNGDYAEVTITFHHSASADPLGSSTPTGRLVVESDATRPEFRTQYVDLGVIGEHPVIATSPEVIALTPNVATSETILVRNVGSGGLTVNDVQLRLLTPQVMDGTGMPVNEFEVSVDTDLPWNIDESGTQTITVNYNPFDDIADTAEVVIKSNDAENPDKIVKVTSQPLKGLLQVTPAVGTFELEPGVLEGAVNFGFINNGERTVNVLDIFIDQPGSDYVVSFSGNANSSFPLSAGSEMDGTMVTYHPNEGQSSDGRLVIVTDADNGIEAPADLVAPPEDGSFLSQYKVVLVPLVHDLASVPATLTVNPLSLDFSDVGLDDSTKKTFEIKNDGGAELKVTRIGLSTADDTAAGLATDPQFTISAGGEDVTLAPGDTHEVEIQFARSGTDTVQHFGAVVIESNAEGSPHTVLLTADPPPQN